MLPKIYRKLKWMPVIDYGPWTVVGVLAWKSPEIIRACGDFLKIVHEIRQEKHAKEKTPSDN